MKRVRFPFILRTESVNLGVRYAKEGVDKWAPHFQWTKDCLDATPYTSSKMFKGCFGASATKWLEAINNQYDPNDHGTFIAEFIYLG